LPLVKDCGIEATRFDAKSSPGRVRCATIFSMSPLPSRRIRELAAALALAVAVSGCAVVGVAGMAASAAVTVGGAAVSVGSAVVGTSVKVAGKVVEKTIDVAVPSGAAPVK
jgi:hypothetical protein